jgi:hypothetical protein
MTIVLNRRQFTLAEYNPAAGQHDYPNRQKRDYSHGRPAFGKQGLKELKLLLKTCPEELQGNSNGQFPTCYHHCADGDVG